MISIKVNCSSGTYIRSLAYDIGNFLGTGATIRELKRTRIGDYSLEDSIDVEQFIKYTHKDIDNNGKNKSLESCPYMLSVSRLSERMDTIYIEEKYRDHIINGWPITDGMIKQGRTGNAGLLKKGRFISIRDAGGKLLAVHEIIFDSNFLDSDYTGRGKLKLTRSVMTYNSQAGRANLQY
jgi:tRNA U55 pseudouridine synthase TruB